jgi:LacI family transcriptional regulator
MCDTLSFHVGGSRRSRTVVERHADGRETVPTGQPATIYDIARATGFSASTVSRALHKPGRINATTAKTIRDAAERLGYQINLFARALPTGRTGMVAVVLSDITNPVFFDLVRGAEQACAEQGHTLILAESQGDATREAAVVQRLLPSVDGLVLVATGLPEPRIRELDRHKPLVLANRMVEGVRCIVPDGGAGVRQALDHLVELGHRSLAFLAGPSSTWISAARWQHVFDEALARGMNVVEIGPGTADQAGGRAALRRVLASGVTAVHTFNDLMAIGLLQACRDDGVDVPARLSIVGFDDIFGADLTSPGITTVRSPMRDVGAEAVRMLLADPASTPQPAALLPTVLVTRGSTGPARAAAPAHRGS